MIGIHNQISSIKAYISAMYQSPIFILLLYPTQCFLHHSLGLSFFEVSVTKRTAFLKQQKMVSGKSIKKAIKEKKTVKDKNLSFKTKLITMCNKRQQCLQQSLRSLALQSVSSLMQDDVFGGNSISTLEVGKHVK